MHPTPGRRRRAAERGAAPLIPRARGPRPRLVRRARSGGPTRPATASSASPCAARCCDGGVARCYAGNGIVRDSDPAAELAETEVKLAGAAARCWRAEPRARPGARARQHRARCSSTLLARSVRTSTIARALARRARARARCGSRVTSPTRSCASAVQRGGRGEVEAGRRGDVARVDVACRPALGDRARPAGSRRSRRRRCRAARSSASGRGGAAASRPPRSWASATSPISSTTGPSPAAAAPKAVETVPSMPLAPRLESTRGGSVARRPEGLDVAHRHRGGDEQRRLVRAAARRARRRPRGSLRPSSPSTPSDRLARRARRRCASVASQSGSARGASPPAPARRSVGGRVAAASDVATSTRRRVLPGALGVERDLRHVVEPREPRAQRLGRRQVADAQHEVGRDARPRTPRRAAARRSGRSRRRRGARRTAGRRAAASRRPRRTRPRPRPSAARRARARPATTTPRRRVARAALERSSQRAASGRAPRRAARGARTARPSARPVSSSGSGSSRHERLAQREVQVHRRRGGPRARSSRRGRRACASSAGARASASCVADLEEPLGGAAVELELVDRLPGADLAQLGRAVGGQHAAAARAPRAPRSPAGSSSAAAVPDVQATATGSPVALARPSAKKPAQRSSMCE